MRFQRKLKRLLDLLLGASGSSCIFPSYLHFYIKKRWVFFFFGQEMVIEATILKEDLKNGVGLTCGCLRGGSERIYPYGHRHSGKIEP